MQAVSLILITMRVECSRRDSYLFQGTSDSVPSRLTTHKDNTGNPM